MLFRSTDASVTTKKKRGFQWTPEAQEGVVSLVAVGTKLTQKAIEAQAKKKSKTKKKATSGKRTAAPAPAAAPAAPESSGMSSQTLLLGVGAFVLVAGGVWYATKKKSGAETGAV